MTFEPRPITVTSDQDLTSLSVDGSYPVLARPWLRFDSNLLHPRSLDQGIKLAVWTASDPQYAEVRCPSSVRGLLITACCVDLNLSATSHSQAVVYGLFGDLEDRLEFVLTSKNTTRKYNPEWRQHDPLKNLGKVRRKG